MDSLTTFLDIKQPLLQHRVSLSPDGKYLAYVVQGAHREKIPKSTPLFLNGCYIALTEVDTGETTVEVMKNDCRSWAPSWSMDSSKLAFYADKDGVTKLYVWERNTQQILLVSDVTIRGSGLAMDYPRWINNDRIVIPLLPKGKHLHFGFPNSEDEKGKEFISTAKQMYWMQKDEMADDEQQETKLEDIDYLFRIDIGIADITTGKTRRIVENRKATLAFPSLGGQYLLFSAPNHKQDMTRFDGRLEELYLIDLQEPERHPILIDSDLPSNRNIRHDPAWSPYSGKVAYLKQSYLMVYNPETKEKQTIKLNLEKVDQRFLVWHPDEKGWIVKHGKQLSFIDVNGETVPLQLPKGKIPRGIIRPSDLSTFYSSDGQSCLLWTDDKNDGTGDLIEMPLTGGKPKLLYQDRDHLQCSSFHRTYAWFSDVSKDGSKIILAAENTYQPIEMYVLSSDFKGKRKVSSLNPNISTERKAESVYIKWEDTKGKTRNGIVLIPKTGSDEKFPLIVNVYPNMKFNAFKNSWDLDVACAVLPPQLLVEHGYAVFIPELYVDTEHFMKDIINHLDISLKSVGKIDAIDMSRLGLLGHSFGGFTVNCIITQTNRFKAAISSAGYGDLISAYSSNYNHNGRIDGFGCQWLETGQMNQGGPPWEYPERYIANSPLFHLQNVQTPLMLLGGEKDTHYMPEGMLVGLERLSKKVRCYVYEGEEHVPSKWRIDNRLDVAKKTLMWFDEHVRVTKEP